MSREAEGTFHGSLHWTWPPHCYKTQRKYLSSFGQPSVTVGQGPPGSLPSGHWERALSQWRVWQPGSLVLGSLRCLWGEGHVASQPRSWVPARPESFCGAAGDKTHLTRFVFCFVLLDVSDTPFPTITCEKWGLWVRGSLRLSQSAEQSSRPQRVAGTAGPSASCL